MLTHTGYLAKCVASRNQRQDNGTSARNETIIQWFASSASNRHQRLSAVVQILSTITRVVLLAPSSCKHTADKPVSRTAESRRVRLQLQGAEAFRSEEGRPEHKFRCFNCECLGNWVRATGGEQPAPRNWPFTDRRPTQGVHMQTQMMRQLKGRVANLGLVKCSKGPT